MIHYRVFRFGQWIGTAKFAENVSKQTIARAIAKWYGENVEINLA